MTIEYIDPNDIPRRSHDGVGRRPGELTGAMLNLLVGEAIKTPCRWVHNNSTNGCGGASRAWQIGKDNEMKFATRCQDKVFYVRRVA